MKKILVLMSTYNGCLFLREQIDSILSQKDVEVMLIIRDDGSTDETKEILESYIFNDNIEILLGDNRGIAKSYRELINLSRKVEVDYFAFADQDDIWLDNKLISAINILEQRNQGQALSYCSDLNVVDKNLKHIYFAKDKTKIEISKSISLVQNIATGCTMVFNSTARDLFMTYEPKYDTVHDYWMLLICVFLGEVVYDENSYILYRQHENNAIGIDVSFFGKWRKIVLSLKKIKEHPRENRAKDFLMGFNEMLTEEDKKIISTVANYRESMLAKLQFLFCREIRMLTKKRDFFLRIRILINSV